MNARVNMKYKSPSNYLNKFFKGKNKFIYNDDYYKNNNYKIVWIENETFCLEKRIIDKDVGADYFEDIAVGDLVTIVDLIKKDII
jgi:hypothetical protein